MMAKYDWKKTASKVFTIAVEVVLAGLISYATDNPSWMGLVPIFEGLRNFIKHYKR